MNCLRPGTRTRTVASPTSEQSMKRFLAAVLVLALAGCIPIGFRSSTQLIAPPQLVQHAAD